MILPFETKDTKQAIIFIGIQASGKSTFYNEMLAPLGYCHINLDTLHTRSKEHALLENYLNEGKSFVIDNTNPEIADRLRYIPLVKTHGYEVIGIFFQSIVRDCIARNENRKHAVPRKAIPSTQNKLQLPSYSEGFDKLFFARIADNRFEITDWNVCARREQKPSLLGLCRAAANFRASERNRA